MNALWKRTLSITLVGALLPAMLVACDDDEDNDTDQTTTATLTTTSTTTTTRTATTSASPSRTSSPPASGTPGANDGPTDDDEINDVIAEIEAGDTDALVDRVQTVALECTTAPGAGGPPQCETGEDEGSEVNVFPFAACEGEHIREADIEAFLQRELIDAEPELYAVFEISDDGTDEFPRGDWGILFETTSATATEDGAILVGVNDDGDIIDAYQGCQASAEEIFETQREPDGEVLLEPAS
jgi:hypothetical protein